MAPAEETVGRLDLRRVLSRGRKAPTRKVSVRIHHSPTNALEGREAPHPSGPRTQRRPPSDRLRTGSPSGWGRLRASVSPVSGRRHPSFTVASPWVRLGLGLASSSSAEGSVSRMRRGCTYRTHTRRIPARVHGFERLGSILRRHYPGLPSPSDSSPACSSTAASVLEARRPRSEASDGRESAGPPHAGQDRLPGAAEGDA